jgi:hypothetical protein
VQDCMLQAGDEGEVSRRHIIKSICRPCTKQCQGSQRYRDLEPSLQCECRKRAVLVLVRALILILIFDDVGTEQRLLLIREGS